MELVKITGLRWHIKGIIVLYTQGHLYTYLNYDKIWIRYFRCLLYKIYSSYIVSCYIFIIQKEVCNYIF